MMKKTLLSLLLVIVMIFALSSCTQLEELLPYIEEIIGGFTGTEHSKTYVDFTPYEKELIKEQVGCDIPFLPNDEYFVDPYSYDGETGVNFYTFGNTYEEFFDYRSILAEYSYVGSHKDSYGCTWYSYENDDVFYDIAYYLTEDGEYCVDLYVYVLASNGNEGGNNNGGNNGDNNGNQGGDNEDNNGGSNNGGQTESHTYTGFTSSEKELFNEFCGFVVPFIANDEYYVEAYTYEDEVGINFYAIGNTAAEFSAYKSNFSIYAFVESFTDSYGDVWYTYEHNGFYIDISYYYYDGYGYLVDVYVYTTDDNQGGGSDNNGGNTDPSCLYTSFTSSEKSLFNQYFGEVIPFLPNNEYYVEEYTFEDEVGINFYTFGNTSDDFNAYRNQFSGYTLVDTYYDDYGDAWYTYYNGSFYVDMSYYDTDEHGWCIDVYAFTYVNDDNSGNNGENNGGNGGSITTDLPQGNNGVYDIDFTDATNVKDVTDLGYYIDGCPTIGSPAVLVIPVEFRDVTAASKGYTTEAIMNAFMKDGECDYYSVYDYYYISSYGQLTLDITVLDYWFRPQYSSSYYANATLNYYGEEIWGGDQLIMDEALAYLATIMDLSKFDSDNNGTIDAVVFINTLEIGDTNFEWAYRYWNLYTDSDGYYYEYDGVSANDYLWASYQFLYEAEDGLSFDDISAMNPYTFIHEFGHILGAEDYYDTAHIYDPMDRYDVMASMRGDHNAFTKFNYGWLTTSRLVVTDTSVTLTLEDFSKNGDTIIIANSWDEKLGAYQEYYIVVYYTSSGLNDEAIGGGYFPREGIVVYHINAVLKDEEYDGITYYYLANSNTDPSDEYGSEDNLIEFVMNGNDTYTYVVGDSLPSVIDDNGNYLAYTFTVDALDGEYATLTFTKR